MLRPLAIAAAATVAAAAAEPNMKNMNGLYGIANLPAGSTFSTEYAKQYEPGQLDYFDVYSPEIKTVYGQVKSPAAHSPQARPAALARPRSAAG